MAHHTSPDPAGPPLVARPRTSSLRHAVLPSATDDSCHDGRFSQRLGSTYSGPLNPRCLVQGRELSPHQCTGASGSHQSLPCLRTLHHRQSGTGSDGQHLRDVLPQQRGRHSLFHAAPPDSSTVPLVHSTEHLGRGHSPSRRRQHSGRRPQQVTNILPRVASQPPGSPVPRNPVGKTDNRHVRFTDEPAIQTFLCQDLEERDLSRGRLSLQMDPGSPIHVPSVPSLDTGGLQNPARSSGLHTDHPVVASPTLVRDASSPVQEELCQVATQARPSLSPERADTPPRCGDLASDCLANPALNSLPDTVQAILRAALKPSTAKSYGYKLQQFFQFMTGLSKDPETATTTEVLLFLTSLSERGLSTSSIRCYLAAVSSFLRKLGRPSPFTNPMVKAFLKGHTHLHPPVHPPTPRWSLELVLSQLQRRPFEPMALADWHLLSWKTAFLVAVTSGRRVSELCALRSDEPYIRFHRDKVVLRPDISFLPKVVTSFHLNQDLVLPSFFQNPTSDEERSLHSLDVRRALSFYIQRTAEFRLSTRLFVCYGKPKQGLPVSPQRFSKWVSSAIALAYELSHRPLPPQIRSHLTRAHAASAAFLAGVPAEDICRAATWSQPTTFTRCYRIDERSQRESAFGRAVLYSSLH